LTTSVRGSGLSPTIDARAALGVSAFMKEAFGVRFLAAVFFAAVFGAVFFAAVFFATALVAVFFTAAFFGAAFFTAAFFGAAFFAAVFVAAGFLAVAFFAAGFFAAFLAVAMLGSPGSMSAVFVSNGAFSEGKRVISTGAKHDLSCTGRQQKQASIDRVAASVLYRRRTRD
jgi:hypothetical protein